MDINRASLDNRQELIGKADLHIHSEHSDGMASVAEILDYVELYTDLDLIAITDHDMFDGAERARDLAARRRYRFQVMTGSEITTLEGHLLVLGIEKPIRSLQSLAATIAQAHAQGGICIVPHPMSWLIRSVGRHGILRIHGSNSSEVYFDGIELLNHSMDGKVAHLQAIELNRTVLKLPGTGGSDAHTLELIGTAATLFPGRNEADFRGAILDRATKADGHFWTRSEVAQLARIGPRQMYRSLFQLPMRHVLRAARAISGQRS